MEWLRWIITIAVIAGAGYLGRDYGRTEMLAEARKQAIDERDQANAELREQVESGKDKAEQERADLVVMQASIEALTQRSGSIGAQLRSALSASNLSTCVLPADVQRLRADAYDQAATAVTRANQARGGE